MPLSATSRVKFVDKREYAQHQVVLNWNVRTLPTLDPFENICLGLVSHLLPFRDIRLPQLIRYTVIVLSERTCADAEPPHLPHEFRDFANLLAPGSAPDYGRAF